MPANMNKQVVVEHTYQREEKRQQVMDISLNKFKCIQDAEYCLDRAVRIKNTITQLQKELDDTIIYMKMEIQRFKDAKKRTATDDVDEEGSAKRWKCASESNDG